jgi:hypothetical protein
MGGCMILAQAGTATNPASGDWGAWQWFLASVLLLFALVAAGHWWSYFRGTGRYAQPKTVETTSAAMLFIGKLISEFKHFLALVIMVVFLVAIVLVVIAAWPKASGDLDKLYNGIQVVVASMGGLVGSVVGYYFGEAKMERAVAAGAAANAAAGGGRIEPTVLPTGQPQGQAGQQAPQGGAQPAQKAAPIAPVNPPPGP